MDERTTAAINLAPDFAYAYWHRGDARSRLDDRDGAQRDWQAAAELAPTWYRQSVQSEKRHGQR